MREEDEIQISYMYVCTLYFRNMADLFFAKFQYLEFEGKHVSMTSLPSQTSFEDIDAESVHRARHGVKRGRWKVQ